jgi:ligand-binding sensor domain-containing protein
MGTRNGIVRLESTDMTVVHAGTSFGLGVCAPASDGGSWIATGVGVHHLTADGASLKPIAQPPALQPDSMVSVVLEDGAGRLWVNTRERICHAPATSVLHGQAVTWTCEDLPPGTVHLNRMVELPDGHLWAASTNLGVLHRTADGWAPLAANADLPTRSILNLVPSRQGGSGWWAPACCSGCSRGPTVGGGRRWNVWVHGTACHPWAAGTCSRNRMGRSGSRRRRAWFMYRLERGRRNSGRRGWPWSRGVVDGQPSR